MEISKVKIDEKFTKDVEELIKKRLQEEEAINKAEKTFLDVLNDEELFTAGKNTLMVQTLKGQGYKEEKEDKLFNYSNIADKIIDTLPKILTDFLALIVERKIGSIKFFHHLGLFQSKYMIEDTKFSETNKNQIVFTPKIEYIDYYNMIPLFVETLETVKEIRDLKSCLKDFDYRKF